MMPEFLMCPPSNFAVNYVGNIWMKPLQHINKERALIQWRSVRDALRTCGGKVHMLPVEKSLPDQVFAANIGVVSNKIFLSSNFRYRQRRKESVVARKWFRKKGFTVRKIPHSIRFEGMGDVIFIDRKSVAMGYGFRSSKGALHYVHSAGLCVPLHLHLIDPRFYHLDTCFVVVNGVAVFYPGAFDAASRKKIRNYFAKKIEVAEKDALERCVFRYCIR